MNTVVLVVLDGFGVATPSAGNAISVAKPRNLRNYIHIYPNTVLKASGEAVGLPESEVGSTEVGHLNMGAGRIVYQSLPRINLSIADGTFFKNTVFLEALEHAKKRSSALHIIGLISGGIVHSSIDHLFALLALCKQVNFNQVFIHVITDGRDAPPKSAATYLQALEAKIKDTGVGRIASIMGRFYGMDRDKRWERVQEAYHMLTKGSQTVSPNWNLVLDESYKKGITDEFIVPTSLGDGKPTRLISKNDAVIFYNYRIDRPRELTKAFVLDDFKSDANRPAYDPYATKYYKKHEVEEKKIAPPFERGEKINNLYFVTMTEYEQALPTHVAFPPKVINMPLGRVIAENKLSQVRIAESEKERFVTFYFNGLKEEPFEGEERIIVPSPKVATYDLKPEMSSREITDKVLRKIADKKYNFILVNYACPDMVGHTGNLKAALKAVAAVDESVGKIVELALKNEAVVLITGDHGNVEEMIDLKTGQPSTEHTNNPVYFIAAGSKFQGKNVILRSGILADIAPTILGLMGINKPDEMTGRNLLEEVEG